MEQLSPNHKRSLSDNLLDASSEDMEMKQLSPNLKRILTRSDTLPPRMEMDDSSNIGYGQFSKELVDTSQIKSHSQEISSQTGLDPHLDRYLSDDLENNKDSLERSDPKVIWQGEYDQMEESAPGFETGHINSMTGEDFHRPVSPPKRRRPQGSPSFSDSAQLDELNFTRASNVTVSNFVSVKLCGKSNYHMWRTQMVCLMRSHNMLGLIDTTKELPGINKNPELTKRYVNLFTGWLIGSLSEEVIKDERIYEKDAKGIWDTLEEFYDPYTNSPTEESILLEPRDKNEKQGMGIEPKLTKKLHNATLEGHWWKAKSILENNLDAATWAINDNGDTLLHLAVKEGNNYFIKMLLNIIDTGERIKIANSNGHTALHIAAIVGNKDAAELLVDKRKELLEIEDKKSQTPLACAYLHKQVNAFVYLWKVTHDVREVTQRSIDESLPPKKSEKDTKIEVDKRLKVFGTEIFNFLEEKRKEKEKQEQEKQEKQEKEKEKEKVNSKSLQDKEKQEKQEKEKEKEKVNSESLQDKEKEKQEKEKQKQKQKQKEENEKFISKIGESLLHTAIFNKEYDLAKKLVKINPGLANEPLTLVVLTTNFPSQISFKETLMYPSLNDVCHKLVQRSVLLLHSLEYLYARAGDALWKMRRFKNKYYYSLFPELVISLLVPAAVPYLIYQLLCLLILLLRLPVSMLYFILWKVLAFLVVPIKNIEKRRMEHKEAKKFLKFICSLNSMRDKNRQFDKFYKESLMEAACLDVYEVLDQILRLSSNAMKAQNKDGHNIIQLAVLNRSAKVYNLLTTKIDKGSYMDDFFGNNLLHFAGRLAPLRVLNCTSGAALQLQRELQWYEEVKKLLVHPQHIQMNVFSETPEMVFSKEHANFVQDGEKWMKATAESCSITAALIITIVFAAAITVPGGSNQDTGIPLFKRKVAFNIFAVADAVSLFSASTSLLVFLSILTSRFIENDFLITLPRRLFVGLCLLFLSTTAMMLAFSTILFLVFCDERPWMLAPIGGLTCIPIAAIVTLQLPLVIDLYQAISITIFDKEPNEEDEEEENREEKEEDEEEDKEIEHNMEGITIRF